MFITSTQIDNGVTKQKTMPSVPAASPDDLIELLRLDTNGEYNAETGYLTTLLMTASQYAAHYLRRALLTSTYVRQYEQPRDVPRLSRDYKIPDVIELPYPPLVTVDRVYVVSTDDTEHDVADYVLDNVSEPARIRLRSFTTGSAFEFLRIEYTAGYGDHYTDVPQLIQQGILQHAAYMYEHRGDCGAEDAARLSGAVDMYHSYQVGVV